VSQLEIYRAEWTSLEAEFTGSQGLTVGCDALAGMELEVLFFNTVSVIFVKISSEFLLTANFRVKIIYNQMIVTKKHQSS
jgi:hypothetical protein